jgi:hypothetical protein
VVKQLHLSNRLTTDMVITKLMLYQRINDRAPRSEIKEMIEEITSTVAKSKQGL